MKKLLRKIKRVLPRPNEYYYYSRDHYYERLSAKYGKIESYVNLLNNNSKLLSLESKIQIKPELGCGIETIVKKFGEPYHRLTNITALKIQILFYKFMMGGHKTKCEMHFFKNKLFLFNYTFSYLIPKDKIKIIELLSKKYLDKSVDLKNHKITDEQGNEIFIHDSADFIINYLACKSDFFCEAESTRSREKDQNEMKSDLNNKEIFSRL